MSDHDALRRRLAMALRRARFQPPETAHVQYDYYLADAVLVALHVSCRCGKPLSHLDADEDSREWPCRVPESTP